MRIFISYARVDKPYCKQIVDLLDMHEVWYDHRLHVGQNWWDEILRKLDWCDGILYLLSPESVASEYCQREMTIGMGLGKPIFPTRIHPRAAIPAALQKVQYADLSNGLDAHAVKELLTSIFVAERQIHLTVPAHVGAVGNLNLAPPASIPETSLIEQAAGALETGDYDRAVFLLKHATEKGFKSRFIDIPRMLHEAESALEHQMYLREAEREYAPIAALIKRDRTRGMGCDAFNQFQNAFPGYDPEDLESYCGGFQHAYTQSGGYLPMLEWCQVQAGRVTIDYETEKKTYYVDPFRMSKYPVTNEQFQVFVDAEDGYFNERWWNSSLTSCEWHRDNPKPMPPKFDGVEYPCGNICWYEAVAFCQWLSYRTGLKIALPTEQQWQRAAQGDDGRLYPWGNKFNKTLCNTKESGFRTTTPVTQYPRGVSPFGIFDMAGNIWEWCLNGPPRQSKDRTTDEVTMAVRGGSCISSEDRARNTFHFYLNPRYRYASIGFRLVCEAV